MDTDKCFSYSAECPLHIGFYYNEGMDACPLSRQCYASWLKSGGQINGNFEWCK